MWGAVAIAVLVLAGVQAVAVAGVAALKPRVNIYKVIIGVVVGLSPVVFMLADRIALQPLRVDGRAFAVLLHGAIGGLLFHFMTLPDRSVTLRVLVELYLAPDGTMSFVDLARRYSIQQMIVSRVEQLEAGRFLTIGPGGALRLLPRGERFGRFVVAGRRLFRIQSAN